MKLNIIIIRDLNPNLKVRKNVCVVTNCHVTCTYILMNDISHNRYK